MAFRALTSSARPLTSAVRYAVSLLLVAASVAVRLPLEPWLGAAVPYLLFFPAITLAALIGGFGPGFLATLASGVVAAYWLLPPHFTFAVQGDGFPFLAFIATGALIAYVASRSVSAEAALEQARDRLQRQFKAIPIPTYAYEWNGSAFVLSDYNDAAFEQSNGSIARAIGRSAREANPDGPDLTKDLAAVLHGKTGFMRQYTHDGPLHPVHLVARFNFAPPNGVIVHVENITDVESAEQVRQQLGAIVESSDDAIVGMDLSGRIVSWNRGAETTFGYTAAEAAGRSIQLIIPVDRWAEEEEVLGRMRAGERAEHVETVRLHKNGHEIDMSISFSPIKNVRGETVGVSKVGRDITERKRSERTRDEMLAREQASRAEAVDARDRLAFLVAAGDLLTSSLDYEETLRRVARLAVPRLGDYCSIVVLDDSGALTPVAWAHVDPAKEPILRELAAHLSGPARWTSLAARVMEAGRTLQWRRDDGTNEAAAAGADEKTRALAATLDPLAYTGVPMRVGGRPVGVISLATTIVDSGRSYSDADVELIEEFARRASVAIENARLFARAEELNRLKDEFLATLSHELRTPLSAILGWARMLRQNQVIGDARQRALESIERNAQAQSRIVEDILDVARGMTGNLRVELAPVNLVDIARRAVDAVAPATNAKQIAVDVRAAGPIVVDGDATRLQQVVWNLLSNAVKFTPRGGRITVGVERGDSTGVLTVADTGIGITPEFLPVMFDKFRQQDQSFTRQFGGLGLGLAIVRQLVELHGGSVEAASEGHGRGACFKVHLPLAASQAISA